jgi:hypothetical protein
MTAYKTLCRDEAADSLCVILEPFEAARWPGQTGYALQPLISLQMGTHRIFSDVSIGQNQIYRHLYALYSIRMSVHMCWSEITHRHLQRDNKCMNHCQKGCASCWGKKRIRNDPKENEAFGTAGFGQWYEPSSCKTKLANSPNWPIMYHVWYNRIGQFCPIDQLVL